MSGRRRPAARAAALAVAGAFVLAGACAPAREDGASRAPTVVATIAPLAWFVERLAGDAVEIVVLVDAATSPEHVEPGVRERKALQSAALVVEVGHPGFAFERGWLAPLLADAGDVDVVTAWDGIDGGGQDPHVWLDPAVGVALIDRLVPALVRLVPGEAEEIERRAARLGAEVRTLEADLAGVLARYRGQRFFVFHPAWGAFAERYGLVQVAVETHGSEPGPEHLAEIVTHARAAGITTVFVQPQFAERGIRVLADEIGADVAILDPLAHDWADNLRRTATALARSFERLPAG